MNFSFLQKIKLLSVSFSILLVILFVLPVANKKTIGEIKKPGTTPLFASVAVPANYSETKQLPVINRNPVPAKAIKEKVVRVKKIAITPTPEEFEYNTALINEELLTKDKQIQLQDMAIQAANKELQAVNKIIVKIEEEQSGVKDKKTYIVELKNNDGRTEIKPLVIFNKKVKKFSEKATTKLTTTLRKATVKKRTTA